MRRTLVLLTLIAAVLVALPSSASAKTYDVTVGVPSNTFTPSSLTIEVGDTVRWTNKAGNHNVVALDGTFYSGSPSSDGWTYSFTFMKVGTYDYVCAVHSQMTGVIVVVPSDDPSPTPTATSTSPSPSPSPTSTSTSPAPSPTVTSTSPAPSPTSTSSPRPTTTATATSSPTSGTTTSPTASPTSGPTSGSTTGATPGASPTAPTSTTEGTGPAIIPSASDGSGAPSDGVDVLGERQKRESVPSDEASEPAVADSAPATTDSTGTPWILALLVTTLLTAAGGIAILRRRQT